MEFELWYLIVVPVLFVAGWWFRGLDQRQRETERQPGTYYKGINLLLNDQPDKAIDAFIEVVKLDPETIELHHALGNLFSRRGEFDRAVRIHNHLLNREDLPAHERALALFELGNDYLKAGIYDRAEDSFKRLLNEPEYHLDAMRALLKIYCTEKEWEKAIEIANTLEKQAGENHQVEVGHFYCELAAIQMRGKHFDKAREELNKALKVDRHSVRALMMLGDLSMLEKDPQTALQYWAKVETVSPEHLTLVMAAMAQAYDAIGQHEQALNLIHRALDDHSSAETLSIALDLITKSEGEEAGKKLLQEELARRPSLWAYEKLSELKLKDNPQDADLQLLTTLLKPYVSRPGCYRCSHCGFKAKGFQWLCPGCSSWGSYSPKREEEV